MDRLYQASYIKGKVNPEGKNSNNSLVQDLENNELLVIKI